MTIPSNILIIEDNQADVFLVEQLLRNVDNFSFTLEHTTTVQDAIQILSRSPFDVILLDLSLPDSDQFSGLSTLHEKNPNVPIIILTSNVGTNIPLEALDHGAQDYLSKSELSGPIISKSIQFAIERNKYNQRLLATERENLALQAKAENEQYFRELITSIHHEFRTPLTIIQLSTSLIKARPTPETIEAKSNQINEAIHRFTKLVDYMATVSDLGRVERYKSTVSSAELNNMLQSFKNKHTRISFELVGSFAIAISEYYLLMLLDHLIENALFFSKPGTPVRVTAKLLNEWIEIKVVDQGIGIASAHFDTIFQPFQKVEQPDYLHSRAGLGLSVVQAITRAYGGSIKVCSELNEGSTFTIFLPAILEP